MKYVVFLGDGMSDTPVDELNGKTPLQVANKPNIDALAPFSELGLAKTVPDGMKPGSDTANLSIMGYNPKECYSGRSPLEALSMGLTLADDDIAVRCNLVTLSTEETNYEDKTMVDYSAGEIDTKSARELIKYVNDNLGNENLSFNGGISYRHCLVMHHTTIGTDLTPPHDITGKKITTYLPKGVNGELFAELEKKSYDLLMAHPINVERIQQGKKPANSIWFWGEGTKPNLADFKEKNGISGAVISAVDLLKGIGKGANMKVIEVEGATGNLNTNFKGKGKAAIKSLKDVDYVYIHVEAPDESGHQGNLNDKIKSIELIDAEIVGPVVKALRDSGEDFHVLICPDHPTPLATRTHSADPIPYMIYRSNAEKESGATTYDEESAKATGIFEADGYKLIDKLLSDGEEKVLSNEAIVPATEEESAKAKNTKKDKKSKKKKKAENESTTAENDKKENAEEKQDEPKEKKPNWFVKFVKAHKLLVSIIIASLLVAAGITVGHFVATRNLVFIHSAQDLKEALAESNRSVLVFKDDITYDGDLTVSKSFNWDMNDCTVKVNGVLNISSNNDISIGKHSNKTYKKGGKIICDELRINTGSKNVTIASKIETNLVDITCGTLTINNDAKGETLMVNATCATLDVTGNIAGKIALSEQCDFTLIKGAVNEVSGGEKVSAIKGEINEVKGVKKVFIYPDAEVGVVKQVENCYYVKQLEAPKKVLIMNENNEYFCYVSEVVNATHFKYAINGKEGVLIPMIAGGTTKFKLEGLTYGEQKVKIIAIAQGNPAFIDSEATIKTFDFSTQIQAPTLTISEEDGKIMLEISEVKYATKYTYEINGKATTKEGSNGLKVDITDQLVDGGVYVIEVTAKADNKYFTNSNKTMISYVKKITLATPEVTATYNSELGEGAITWSQVENASLYILKINGEKVYTNNLTYTFESTGDEAISVQAIGSGWLLDSAEVLISMDDLQG